MWYKWAMTAKNQRGCVLLFTTLPAAPIPLASSPAHGVRALEAALSSFPAAQKVQNIYRFSSSVRPSPASEEGFSLLSYLFHGGQGVGIPGLPSMVVHTFYHPSTQEAGGWISLSSRLAWST